MAMVATAWNNGAHHESGAGYGLKVDIADRDHYFSREWQDVVVQFPNGRTALVNIDKDSFWGATCRELIHKEIGVWLRSQGLAPWAESKPPKLTLEPTADNKFLLSRGPFQFLTEQGRKEMLLHSLRHFPEELKKWCKHRELEVSIPENWPASGVIAVSKGSKRMEIEIADPDSGDTQMKLDRIWGVRLKAVEGSMTLLSRWPDTWKAWNRVKIGWDDIDFGEHMDREVSNYFIKERTVPVGVRS